MNTSNHTTDESPTLIHVYREHAEWGRHAKWFQLPSQLLSELFVTTYTTHHEIPTADDLAFIRAEHPNCVLVYIG